MVTVATARDGCGRKIHFRRASYQHPASGGRRRDGSSVGDDDLSLVLMDAKRVARSVELVEDQDPRGVGHVHPVVGEGVTGEEIELLSVDRPVEGAIVGR